MKNNSSIISSNPSKQKLKLLSCQSNVLQQKPLKQQKQKPQITTQKKLNNYIDINSPRNIKKYKNELLKNKKNLQLLSYGSKNQKININMEIKNLNIYSSGQNSIHNQNHLQTNLKKKKLHKKNITCLNTLVDKQPKPIIKQQKKLLKHTKTKSQQTIKLNPKQWSQLLTKYIKTKKTQDFINKIAYCNRCGTCPQKKNKINQDSFVIIQNFIKQQRYLLGVCDGHGINGHYVSQFIKQILPQNIQYYFLKNKNINKIIKTSIESSIKQAFQKTSKDLLQSGIDIMFSGTTTCLVYIEKNHLYCANLGDSRAVLFSKQKNQSTGQQQQWNYQQLSTDHKAQDKRQALRIQMNGGRVFSYRDEDGEQMGPLRVWVKQQNIPGLAMTRSFGDYIASTVGVIDQPQILHHQLTKQNKFMIIASDGLWQFINSQQILTIVTPSFIRNDAESAVKDLQNAALQAWKKQDQSVDDITIIVVFFKYYS